MIEPHGIIEPDDRALARAAQAGEVDALAALLGRHLARMRAVAVGLLGPGPDAEDAVQDACMQALCHVGELRNPDAARSWLVAIVANACRARRRRPGRELPAERLEDLPGGEDVVERAVETAALRDGLWAAIDRLPAPLWTVLVLRYFTDASSYAAIAQLCDTPVGTVRSRLHAARTRLADELLSTAARGHGHAGYDALGEEIGGALHAFQQTGDEAVLADRFSSRVRFRLADGVEHEGRARYAAALTGDFADGVRARPLRVTTGPDLVVAELELLNPADQPLHCPPLLTQILRHDGALVSRITSYYASGP